MKKPDLFWQTYLNLEKTIIDLSKYIYITDVKMIVEKGIVTEQSYPPQMETFSPFIADLIIQTCVQIEAISKELYYDIGGSKPRRDNSIHFDEDCLKEIDKKWGTHDKVVLVVAPFFNLTKDENRILKPLKEAHKRQGTYWERAYQAVKHDRYSSLAKGNIKALLQAMAALYLLNLYYRNESWITSYNDISKIDMSLGSRVFSVNPPKSELLWYGNNPQQSDSPYIVKYQDEAYKRIKECQDAEEMALNEYWQSQPETNEPEFQKQLMEASQHSERVMSIWELGKYRLNKKIPKELPFEKRKELLLNSKEWNGKIHRLNNPKKAEEITQENIQAEIDSVGRMAGMDIMRQYQKLSWVNDAMNKECCEVRIG